MKAEIMKVKGGCRAIATMTFDDGLVRTANALEELCEKHDCRASLMLTTHRLNDETAAMWNELFDKGHLRPDNHSHSHMYLDTSHPENLTEENMTREIEASFDLLKKYFPKYDCLGFAIPYSSYAQPAMEYLCREAYASRSGVCVLYNESGRGKMQSLDPTFDRELGSWYAPYAVRMMPEKPVYHMITPETLTEYLDKCVRECGWFISVSHGIVEGENLDITVDDLDKIMEKMHTYSERGELWVTDFSSAVKYIRERQNSTLALSENVDGTATLALTMSDTAEDGHTLPSDVFNMPLTVRLELPEGAKSVEYTDGNGTRTATAYTEDGITYTYLDLVPNGGDVILRPVV